MKKIRKIIYIDDDTETIRTIFMLRLPPLAIGLALGMLISLVVSRFEEVLYQDIRVVFFLPFVIYIAGAVGAQTTTIYTRDVKSRQAIFLTYLIKESILGIFFGILFGAISTIMISIWLGFGPLALGVGISIFISVLLAPIVGLLVVQFSKIIKEDPAAEGGPIGIVMQDMLSVIIYGLVFSNLLI